MGVTGGWIILELVIEILILGLILSFMILNRKGRWRKDAESLKSRISEADTLFIKADQELNERFSEMKDLLVRLKKKEEALIKWMEMTDRAMQEVRESTKAFTKERLNQRGLNYEDVIKLMEKGVSQRDISRITGIGEAEIDLILKLKRKG
jgi:uncharacterized membrane-anchored protein YhcB (DUF1043 family)